MREKSVNELLAYDDLDQWEEEIECVIEFLWLFGTGYLSKPQAKELLTSIVWFALEGRSLNLSREEVDKSG